MQHIKNKMYVCIYIYKLNQIGFIYPYKSTHICRLHFYASIYKNINLHNHPVFSQATYLSVWVLYLTKT